MSRACALACRSARTRTRLPSRAGASLLLAVLATLMLSGCERTFRNMYDQPKHLPAGTSPVFGDGLSSRPPPPGSVAQSSGDNAGISSGQRTSQAIAAAEQADATQRLPNPLPGDLLERGRERFNIYCMPCHSPLGDGDGRVVQRGFPAPPSFHIDRLREAGDRYFYDVISKGYGVMYPYADRVEPADRWAIVAYIRALQLSQHADVRSLPGETQAQLASMGADAGTRPARTAPAATAAASEPTPEPKR